MPKRLLRSVIDFEDGKTTAENLSVNFRRLQVADFEWSRPADQKLFNYLMTFFQDRLELPTGQTVHDFFNGAGDTEVLERLKDVKAAPSYVQMNFSYLLQTQVETQNRIKMGVVVKETEEILTKGLLIQEGREKIRLQGIHDAFQYFTQKAHELIPSDLNVKSRGDIRADTEASWQEYQDAKHNKGAAYGAMLGLNHIDKVIKGLKAGELWVHAAYAGELKTMFATNWAYQLVTRYRTNVVYYTLEVPYSQIRRIMAALHSAHPKFAAQGYTALDYRKVRDAELSDEEEAFYQLVLKDWGECPDYCHFEIIAPPEDMTIADIRLDAELLHKQFAVGMIFIDHSENVKQDSKDSSYTVRLNKVIRDAKKKLALQFNGGEGVAVCLLHQINREGRDWAAKNEGKYKMKALSYSHECERSADVITTTFLDEKHREAGTSMCCNLKSRDNPWFDPFLLNVDFECRRVHNMDPMSTSDIGADDGMDLMLEAAMADV